MAGCKFKIKLILQSLISLTANLPTLQPANLPTLQPMILTEKIDKVTVLSFQDIKSLDAPKAFRLKAEFRALITEPGVKLVVDMSEVDFIDSSGIGILLSVLRLVKSLEGQMKLCTLSSNIFDLFMLLHLEHVFEMFINREKAVASFLPATRLKERKL